MHLHEKLAAVAAHAAPVSHSHTSITHLHFTVPAWLAHRLGAGGPLESWWLATALLVAAASTVVGWWWIRRHNPVPRRRGRAWAGRGSLATGALLTLLGAAVGVNAYAGYVPTLGAALNLATGAPAAPAAAPAAGAAAVPVPNLPAPSATAARLAASRVPRWSVAPAGTQSSRVVNVLLPAPALGMPNGNAYVYLPSGYTPARRYPVLYLLGGAPGYPTDWLYAGNLQGTADALIHQHYVRPYIVVMPRISPRWQTDYEGLNAVNGPQVMTYLTSVVVPAVDTRFSTIADRSGRALAGFSAGADAALNIALHNQAMFAILGAIEPQGHPGSRANWVLADNPRLIAQNSPIVYVPTVQIPQQMAFYLSAGSHSRHGAVPTLASELRQRGQSVVVHDESGFGHTWTDARNDLPYLLQFVSVAFGTV